MGSVFRIYFKRRVRFPVDTNMSFLFGTVVCNLLMEIDGD